MANTEITIQAVATTRALPDRIFDSFRASLFLLGRPVFVVLLRTHVPPEVLIGAV